MPVDANAAKELFLTALDRTTPAERAAFLERACANDADLRTRVDALLQALDEAGSFPDFLAHAGDDLADGSNDPTLSVAATPDDATRTGAGESVGDGLPLGFLAPPRDPGHLGRLDHYEIHSVVGRGGMGVVLRAFDESLDRIVAIKVLGSQYATNGTAKRRFIREAKAVAAVTHEHVVTVHGVDERAPYIVMQYVSGKSLQDRLDEKGPLELKQILRIGMQIASGLSAAHAQGLVHRDIKPSNILLENGIERVKITDFGLARAVDDASLTQSGVIAGTPMYMSPEQAHGESVDPRSDLFSLGSVLYAMCTGHAPFRASGTMAVLKRVVEDTPRSIREVNPEIPGWLEEIVFKMLAKKPGDRFQNAKEVATLLEQHLAHLQHPSQIPMPQPVARLDVTTTKEPALPAALSRLRWPANGLFITGILYWATIPLLFAARFASGIPEDAFPWLLRSLGIVPVVAGFILIFAAWKMKQGELYPICVIAALLPFALIGEKMVNLMQGRMTVALGDLTVLPFGMWALIVLTRNDVRAAFGWVKAETPSRTRRQRWRYALVAIAIALLVPPVIYYSFRTNIDLYRTNTGQLIVNDTDPEFTEFRVESITGASTVNVGSARIKTNYDVWKVKKGEALALPPGHYRVEAIGPTNVKVQRWRIEGAGAFSGFTTQRDEEHCLVEVHRGSRTWLSITKWDHVQPKDAIPSDKERLQGLWIAESGESLGQPFPADRVAGTRLEFTGSNLRVTTPGKPTGEGIFKLDTAVEPKEIDAIRNDDERGMRGIYRLEGDRLTICIGEPGPNRPRTFATGPDTGPLVLLRMRRATGADDGWVQLFNGSDLSGWKRHPDQPGQWRVENGNLVGSGERSHLFSERGDHTNFRLRVEARVNARGNSGVYFRVPAIALPHLKSYPFGFEAQINSTHVDPNKTGSLWRTLGGDIGIIPSRKPPPEPDEWFTLEVIADRHIITVQVNGETTAEFVEAKRDYLKGHIALQVTGEATQVEFRKIEIKELSAVADVMTDHAKLQGKWRLISGESRGRALAVADLKHFDWIVFSGDEFSFNSIGVKEIILKGQFRLNTSVQPRQLDLFVDTPNPNPLIYEITGDTLVLGQRGAMNGPRPTSLTTTPTSNTIVERFRREAAPAESWLQLFNGKDLTGWKPIPHDSRQWSIKDGILRGDGDMSFLMSANEYGDFHLRCEARINDGGDSGIMFWCDKSWTQNKVPIGYEAQINATIQGLPRTGSLEDNFANYAMGRDPLIRPNEWFIYEIIARGSRIELKVNGQTTLDWTDGNKQPKRSGHLALQLANAKTVVEFKKIEIKELPSSKSGKSDQEALQGHWEVLSAEAGGQVIPPEAIKKGALPTRFLFKGNQWGAIYADGRTLTSTAKLSPEKNPAWIDVDETLFEKMPNLHGIYKLDGDRVTICICDREQPRPTAFVTKGKPDHVLIVARREAEPKTKQ